MDRFLSSLKEQRWDDHRYYHQSRVNQSLHFVSAVSFLYCYMIVFKDPALAALIAWLVSMVTRQSGHFFFEPRGYDAINHATHDYKEEVKVGYNLHRKRILMAVWALSPLLLLVDPTLFGTVKAARSTGELVHHVGYIWFVVGAGGFLFRIVQLILTKDAMTAVIWAVKILTDPFHDIALYYKSPLHLGQKPEYRRFNDDADIEETDEGEDTPTLAH
jgi:hypothetical protein